MIERARDKAKEAGIDNVTFEATRVNVNDALTTLSGGSSVTIDARTVTDNNGNVNTCTAEVEVEDNEAPSAVCTNYTVQLTSGTGSITAANVDNGSTDACGIRPLVVSQTSFDCSHVGTNTVTQVHLYLIELFYVWVSLLVWRELYQQFLS